jgi:EmrB/QacA subfamily drug resistance transporter
LSIRPDPSKIAASPDGTKYPAFLVVFPSIMLPMFLAVVDQTIVATALPAIAAATGQVERAPWVVIAYLIAATIAAPLYGRLGDSFGRRRLMFVALPVSILGSLCCAASPTIELLTLGRVLQGLGGGGLMTLSQALIGETIPPRERARYQGYLAAVAVTANTFGPIVGGYVTEHFGWQAVFLVNVPIGLAAIPLTLRLPRPTKDRIEWRSDLGGLVLFTIFVATTLFSLQQIQRADLTVLPLIGGAFAVGLAALAWLIRHENRTASPLIPIRLLRQPAIWRSDGMAACHGAALVSLITFLPVFLEVVRGASPSTTGLLLIPLLIGTGTGSLVTGRLVSRTGLTTVFPVVGLALATVTLVVLGLLGAELSMTELGGLLFCNGVFMGTVMGVVQVMVQSAAGPLRLGEAAASVQFSRSIGAALGTALAATVLFAVLALKNPEALRIFEALVQHGYAGPPLPPLQRAAVQGDIRDAFLIAFLSISGVTVAGFLLALTNPLRRI